MKLYVTIFYKQLKYIPNLPYCGIGGALLALCTLLQLAGCGPTTKELMEQKGYDLSASNKHCDAYDHYRAMLETPGAADDQNLNNSLADTSKECVRQIIRTSQKQIATAQFDLAIFELNKAKRIQPNNKTVKKLIDDANNRQADFKKKLEGHEKTAAQLITQKESALSG